MTQRRIKLDEDGVTNVTTLLESWISPFGERDELLISLLVVLPHRKFGHLFFAQPELGEEVLQCFIKNWFETKDVDFCTSIN